MSALLGALLFLIAPTHVSGCERFELEGSGLYCLDNGITYPEGNYALHHDRDDGDILWVEVWR